MLRREVTTPGKHRPDQDVPDCMGSRVEAPDKNPRWLVILRTLAISRCLASWHHEARR